MQIDFNSGGAKVIDRIMVAYGFKTKLQLCKYLGVSSANLSMRYKRDFFPSDLVVRCMAETGVSLQWLTGEDSQPLKNQTTGCNTVEVMELINGKLAPSSNVCFDKSLLLEDKPIELIKTPGCSYVINRHYESVFSGKYLIEIEEQVGIYDIQRYPINRVKITGDDVIEPIDCRLDDIKVLAEVVTLISHIKNSAM